MRAYEFITESRTDGLNMVSHSLPATYIIPDLKNNDFYELYRFGLAIADVRGNSGTDDVQSKFKPEFKPESTWGEHQIVVSWDPNIDAVLDDALNKVQKKGKTLVSTKTSDEIPNTVINSPMKPFKGYKK